MFWYLLLVPHIHMICFVSYFSISVFGFHSYWAIISKYVKRQIFIKSCMVLETLGAVWPTLRTCREEPWDRQHTRRHPRTIN